MGSGSPACNKRHPYHRCQGRTKRLSLRISGTCLCTTHPLWKCSNLLHRSTSVASAGEKRWSIYSHCSSTKENAQIRGVSHMDPHGAYSAKRWMQSIISGPLQNLLAVVTNMARLGRFSFVFPFLSFEYIFECIDAHHPWRKWKMGGYALTRCRTVN